jgi:5-methylcytosine-specific restriction endonuclease McrA
MTLTQIDERMTVLVKTERGTTREILELIRMAESVRLPEHLSYRDTYHWLIQRHKYSGSAANRRIQASRLLKDLPDVAEKVETGALNLSKLCKMQTVIRSQTKITGARPSVELKREAINGIENKTCNEAEQVLHTLFPEAEVRLEKTVHKKDGGQRCTIELSPEAARLLSRVQEVLSHTMPGASTGEIIERLAEEFLERHDPLIKAGRRKDKEKTNAQSLPPRRTDSILQRKISRSQNVSQAVKQEVLRRAGGQCEYSHENRRCGSRYRLEVDHIIPKGKGGSDAIENLRCLCRNHNQMMAEREFGVSFMQAKRAGGTSVIALGPAQTF